MKLKFLTGDINWREYGAKWISPRQHNGDWPYWLVVEFINWKDTTGEKFNGNKYAVTISAISPEAAGIDNLHKATEYCGVDEIPEDDESKVLLLSDYGVQAQLGVLNGNNANDLMKQARKECEIITSVAFGFEMDKIKNDLGATGWDLIKGNPLRALER